MIELATRGRKNWARQVLVALAALSVLGWLFGLTSSFWYHDWEADVTTWTTLNLLVYCFAVRMLFTDSAEEWFRCERRGAPQLNL